MLPMVFKKINAFFKKNIKIEVVDDTIKLTRLEIKQFLDDNLNEQKQVLEETIKVSYEFLKQNIDSLNSMINSNSKYVQNLKKLLGDIKIPKKFNYFDAHVFSSEQLKKVNSFMYESRTIKERENYDAKLLQIRDILLTLKKAIDISNLMFYDVLLEEMDNQKSLISRDILEYQIFKLTKKKVTIID
jgi:hypothetical protein